MEIRPVRPGDDAGLACFLQRIPEADRTFLKEDVTDPEVVVRWSHPGDARSLGQLVDNPLAESLRPRRCVDDEGAHFGDERAQRCEIGAGDDAIADGGNDEPRDMYVDVLDAARQQMAFTQMRRDQRVNRLDIR